MQPSTSTSSGGVDQNYFYFEKKVTSIDNSSIKIYKPVDDPAPLQVLILV